MKLRLSLSLAAIGLVCISPLELSRSQSSAITCSYGRVGGTWTLDTPTGAGGIDGLLVRDNGQTVMTLITHFHTKVGTGPVHSGIVHGHMWHVPGTNPDYVMLGTWETDVATGRSTWDAAIWATFHVGGPDGRMAGEAFQAPGSSSPGVFTGRWGIDFP
jgi:hypothetical protein